MEEEGEGEEDPCRKRSRKITKGVKENRNLQEDAEEEAKEGKEGGEKEKKEENSEVTRGVEEKGNLEEKAE